MHLHAHPPTLHVENVALSIPAREIESVDVYLRENERGDVLNVHLLVAEGDVEERRGTKENVLNVHLPVVAEDVRDLLYALRVLPPPVEEDVRETYVSLNHDHARRVHLYLARVDVYLLSPLLTHS